MRQDIGPTAARTPRRRLAEARLGERGSVAIEAALVFPLLIVLAMGIVEFSLLMRDHVAVQSLVRAGARTASSLPREATFVQTTADAVIRSGSALPKNSLEELWVYSANAKGYPGVASNADFGSSDCNQNCVRYRWDAAKGKFVQIGGSWAYTNVNACLGDPQASSVGVYVKAKHNWITGLFFDTSTVAGRAVMNFEPKMAFTSTDPCK